jgi:hypothetical protein
VRISRTARYAGASFEPAAQLTADADTLALYDMQEGQGAVLNDTSGHGRHGKIVGPKWTAAGSDEPGQGAAATK